MTVKKQKKSLNKNTIKPRPKKQPTTKSKPRSVSAVKKVSPKKSTALKTKSTKAVKRKATKKRIYNKTKQIVVPTKSNEFIPLIIRRYGVLVIALIILLTQVGYNFIQTGQFGVLSRVSKASIPELISDTNQYRVSRGLQELVVNEKLSQAATLKARDMVTNDYWAHTSPTNVTPWKWLEEVGYEYSMAGENLAKNFPDSDTTISAWMDSTSHRENMLNPQYSEVGFAIDEGVIDGKMTTVVVALYGKPIDAVLGSNMVSPGPYVNNSFATSDNWALKPLAYFGVAVQSLNPATIGALALLSFIGVVSLLTYAYRKHLPTALQEGWRKHHGLFVFVGALVVGVAIILGTGSGQLL